MQIEERHDKSDFSILIKYQRTVLKDTFLEMKRIKDLPCGVISNELNALLVKLQLLITAHPDMDLVEKKSEQANQFFFNKLKLKYPNLTKGEVELCIWLKLGLSSKEVANLKNINMASVKKSRQRLRKKLQISKDEDIYFLLWAI